MGYLAYPLHQLGLNVNIINSSYVITYCDTIFNNPPYSSLSTLQHLPVLGHYGDGITSSSSFGGDSTIIHSTT
eukprot:c39121_g1_i1 orf=3-221(+)